MNFKFCITENNIENKTITIDYNSDLNNFLVFQNKNVKTAFLIKSFKVTLSHNFIFMASRYRQ